MKDKRMSYLNRLKIIDIIVSFVCRILNVNRYHLGLQLISLLSDKKFTEKFDNFKINQTDMK